MDENKLNGDIFSRIRSCYHALSATNKKIADFVSSNYDEVVFISASDLAQQLKTSEAAIVRFSQALGYTGFPDLKRELVGYYREQTTPARKVKRYLEAISPDDEFFRAIIEKDIEYLRNSLNTINSDALWKAVDALCSATHRYVYCTGVNSGLGHYLSYRLNRFCLRTSTESYSGKEVYEKMPQITREDVAVIYGFYQPTREYMMLMRYLKDRGIPNILITDSTVPPMVQDADLILYARRGPFGVFHSQLVPMAVNNALITGVAERLQKDALESLQTLSDLRKTYSIDQHSVDM
ncbi:MAG: MurR/RpiR family transcriptional regulator [Sphaerochaeta sp.]|nr:MurR/RpiR family transcriptional regulator [Sphaerochaeta sp.]MDX9914713.1 MurR/RpiR family transcriptional regulator [Sphaerochaeta sp.]